MAATFVRRFAIPALLLTAAFSQETSQDAVLRITVNLVQVDAVVLDAKGNQVTNLRAGDFEVLQDGKPQKITHFTYVSNDSPAVAAPARVASPAPKNAPPLPPPVLRPSQVRRTVALVVDDLGLSFESMAQVRGALKKFVDEQMRPGDLVAIIRTGAGMGALQQFTSDKRMLHAAIERCRWNLFGRSGISTFAPLGDEQDESELRADEWREEYFSVGTLGAINFVVTGLKDLPGRKSVVLFSDNMRLFNSEGLNDRILDSVRQLTDLANRASVVLYTIDPGGLQTLNLTAADRVSGARLQNLHETVMERHQRHYDSQEGLSYLARETGGLFIHDTNDLTGGIEQVLNDQKGYYLLGYAPEASTFDEATGRRLFHKLSVKVKVPGLHIRSRTGFFGVPERGAQPVRGTRAEQLAYALASPFASGGLRLRLTSLFTGGADGASYVQSLLFIDGRDLQFTDEPEGWHKAVLDVLLMTFGDNGVDVDRSDRTFTLRVRGEEYRRAVRSGFVYTINHPVKKPGAYQMRAAVRDATSEKVGSAGQFIEVPDVNKGRLLLSGLLVRSNAAPAQTAAEGRSPETDPNESPAVRVFRQGRSLMYGLQILNAKLDGGKQPRVEMQMRLLRDGRLVYDGKPTPVEAGQQPDLKRIVAGGRVQLGSRMEPGEYVLQVTVTDKLAGEKHRTATQWMDFEVAPASAAN